MLINGRPAIRSPQFGSSISKSAAMQLHTCVPHGTISAARREQRHIALADEGRAGDELRVADAVAADLVGSLRHRAYYQGRNLPMCKMKTRLSKNT